MTSAKRLDFNVEAIDALHVDGLDVLNGRNLMSPYVWKDQDGFCMLVRAAPQTVTETGDTGAIYFGRSEDGLTFVMDANPVLSPGPDRLDIGGCEDPTLVIDGDRYIVYYTGVDETRSSGQMLYADGPDVHHLSKRGIAFASTKTEGNTKEATIGRTRDGRWRLFYEYARQGASLIGLALGEGVAGPWHEQPAPFGPRTDSWDSWHLSTGPFVSDDSETPVMFYNGATRDARWRIGWVALDATYTRVVDRCIEPLIIPPPPMERNALDIAFAASVVVDESGVHLYYSLADKALFRALIRRS